MPYANKDDRRNYYRKHYQANKDRYAARNRRTIGDKKAYLHKVKSAPCLDCGIKYPYYVMDLDHRPGEIKRFEPANLISAAGWQALVAEVAKCDIVCANCHRIRTHTRNSGVEPPKVQCYRQDPTMMRLQRD